MPTQFRTFMIALACLVAPLSAARAADVLIVQNHNGYDSIMAVHASPSGLSGWGTNRLAYPIPPGEFAEISLAVFGDDICVFDILIEDHHRNTFELFGFDLCWDPIVVHE